MESLEDRRLLSASPATGAYLLTAAPSIAAQVAPPVVNQPSGHPTTTTWVNYVTQATQGQSISYTVKCKTIAATPAGYIQLTIDGTNYGAPVELDGNGMATVVVNTLGLSVGVHVVVADYLSAVPLVLEDSQSTPLNLTIYPAVPAALQTDPVTPTLSNLVVQGSPGQETIAIYPGATGQTAVKIIGPNPYQGSFTTSQIAHVIVKGSLGNNTIWIEPGVKIPAIIMGGDGNNTIIGGQGPAILVGGAGQDTLRAGTGPTILIAGSGVAKLYGSSGYDLLIGGTTSYDADPVSLEEILNEWGDSAEGFHARVSRLSGAKKGGLNGTHVLDNTTVQAGSNQDLISGGSSYNWFFISQTQQSDGDVFNDLPDDVVTYVG
jgi:hypothetical protein